MIELLRFGMLLWVSVIIVLALPVMIDDFIEWVKSWKNKL
jgi:hypothetical protein